MYKRDFSNEGKTSLAYLDKTIGQRVLNKLKWLTQNIEVINPLPLEGDLSGLYKPKSCIKHDADMLKNRLYPNLPKP
jgi:mRNA-degrading endonuclease RelE of RelBE toxin-antitoxin system